METDVLVVGGGHAGIEAAAASSRMGMRTLLVTMDLDKTGELSCNPAIGGVGKGQLVREIDALGGCMGRLADQACLQYRVLNSARGAAVRSSRMQVDREQYPRAARAMLDAIPGLQLAADEVIGLRVQAGRLLGAQLQRLGPVACRAAILTPGTFFHGLIHVGHDHFPGGRWGDPVCIRLAEEVAALGFRLGRFKTGTTPRLHGRTIDFSRLVPQAGDPVFVPFSQESGAFPVLPQVICHIGHTNPTTHRMIREHLAESALYGGEISGTGVRYCPSVEDKIVKFPERSSHHVFLEPETGSGLQYYPNGISNSLPLAVQVEMVRSIAGLEKAEIVQSGYGIEHDYLDPTQLAATLESKIVAGLYFAGQINGTTGYEEAAAQGLLAGINAARKLREEEPVILDRSQAYIGVMIDDLVLRGTEEPYRMFTSRVEYRLVLREDNAAERLTPLGRSLGLIGDSEYRAFETRREALANERKRLEQTRAKAQGETESRTLAEWLARPEVGYAELAGLNPESAQIPEWLRQRASVEIKYAGYIRRQADEIAQFKYLEDIRIPAQLLYAGLPGLSREAVEKLTRARPANLGQASRIPGITPAAVSQLLYYLKRR